MSIHCELSDEIGALAAANDATQIFIAHLEETSKDIEVESEEGFEDGEDAADKNETEIVTGHFEGPRIDPLDVIDQVIAVGNSKSWEFLDFEANDPDDMLEGNHQADDFKMPQLLEVADEEIKLYPSWHKYDSWHVINTTGPATSTNQDATSHDQIEPSAMAENRTQPEPNSVAIAAGPTDAMKASSCEKKVPSPVMQVSEERF
ncbi:hypothetical protein scyTo_0002624 [Scyliorhinus torazame]|uniref:Uncharacterized protein n=1 Tax=Scyliorhinus torazame TaxID=75743 RepID=A0A401PK78_SCYTO|nr:hypothetical protein [Scyliorhinus torazame]